MTAPIVRQMTSFAILVSVVSAGFSAEEFQQNPAALRARVHKTLRETARSTDREAAARSLMETYQALADDTSLVKDDRRQMQQIVRSRLAKLADEIRRLPTAGGISSNESPAGEGLQSFLDALIEKSTRPAAQ